jgi:hypothetical protein
MFNSMLNDWSCTKSYATQENLEKALNKANLADCLPLAVRTPEGRWTAIFALGQLPKDMSPMTPAWAGFKVLG